MSTRIQGWQVGRRSLAVVVTALLLASCASPQSTPSATPAAVAPTLGPSAAATVPPSVSPTSVPPASPVTPTPRPRPAHWAKTGSMREALSGLKAVKLRDGRVLVVGQRNANGEVTATTAELWDPSTGAWRKAAGLDKIRTEFALVALQDGRALVVGGRNTTHESYSSAWAFDPETEHWSRVGLMDTARAAASVAVLPDGRVLVAGGYFANKPNWGAQADPVVRLAAFRPPGPAEPGPPVPLDDVDVPPGGRAMATAELFDPRTGTWSSTGSMRYARAGAPAVTLSDGRVLIAGSTTEAGTAFPVVVDVGALSSAEIYDPATGRFTRAGELPGTDLDPPAWARDGVGGEVNAVGELAALDDGDAVLIGHTEWQKHYADLSTSYHFDAKDKTWSEIGRPYANVFNGPRGRTWTSSGRDLAGATVVSLADGRVLVAGGGGTLAESQTQVVATNRAYGPSTDAWSRLPKLPSARSGAIGVRLDDGSVLVIGGRADGDVRWSRSDRTTIRFVPER